ncbi:MAG: glycogen debranching protein GlgX, partial [Rhodobacteraceae bacterium]|nr:glycogen debranching protein GlgX [Paracoccaceae bacterium]
MPPLRCSGVNTNCHLLSDFRYRIRFQLLNKSRTRATAGPRARGRSVSANLSSGPGVTFPLGAHPTPEGVRFSVWSGAAETVSVCLFDAADAEITRIPLERGEGGVFATLVEGLGPGARYGLRADGGYDPAAGLWFDPAKLLVDPCAVTLDRPFAYDPRLAHKRDGAPDTAPLMPKGVVTALPAPAAPPPLFRPGGLIYEVAVRPFTMRCPDVPPALRGTVAALAHPTILNHLTRLGVGAVELMPIAAWIDERHLGPLGRTNGWGYNPVAMMAPDPRLCPGGIAELRETTAALRAAGIGVILDVVFNHTGESDAHGPTLSLRGLDARAYFRHGHDGRLVNDTGTGNTLACDHPATRRLILDTLRHFVGQAGVDGFRFDLAPILGRTAHGFDPNAALLTEMLADPALGDRILIAEPWDVGPGGYQLGAFPPPFLEWNDRYRDRVRRFWRGDRHMLGEFATALAGSSDVFAAPATRSVNFVAAHDGFTLADLVAYARKHNHANCEHNRDGHDDNHSWNNGAEGPSDDPHIAAARARDLRALLATLFASRGTIQLTAGDEFGRSQSGNNNAYAQDNPLTWLDWAGRDRGLEACCARLSALRRA